MNNEEIEEKNLDNIVKSINILIQSVVKGQNSGIYTLEEASIIMESIKYLQTTFTNNEEKKKEVV